MKPPRYAVRVSAVRHLEPDVREVTLEPASDSVMPFAPGAHLVVHLPLSDGPRAAAFSLTSSPSAGHYRIAVRHSGRAGGATDFIHHHLRVGDTLQVEAPFSAFTPDPRARHHRLLAAGIGITPFMTLVPHWQAQGAAVDLTYLSRHRDAAYLGELQSWLGPRLRFIHTPSEGRPDLARWLGPSPPGTHVYVCGPASLVRTVREAAQRLHWPDARVHHESFGDRPSGQPFEVTLARSGVRIRVGADESLLDALARSGHVRPSQCRSGVCGRCETPLLAGTALHLDQFLLPAQQACAIMPCVSRGQPGPPLLLDL